MVVFFKGCFYSGLVHGHRAYNLRLSGRSGPVSNAISRAFLICFDFLLRGHRSPAAAQLDVRKVMNMKFKALIISLFLLPAIPSFSLNFLDEFKPLYQRYKDGSISKADLQRKKLEIVDNIHLQFSNEMMVKLHNASYGADVIPFVIPNFSGDSPIFYTNLNQLPVKIEKSVITSLEARVGKEFSTNISFFAGYLEDQPASEEGKAADAKQYRLIFNLKIPKVGLNRFLFNVVTNESGRLLRPIPLPLIFKHPIKGKIVHYKEARLTSSKVLKLHESILEGSFDYSSNEDTFVWIFKGLGRWAKVSAHAPHCISVGKIVSK